MKTIVESIWIAISFFTILPVKEHYEWTEERMKYVPLFIPLVGVIIGSLLYGVIYLLNLSTLSLFTGAFIVVIFFVLITGGLHHDALMDTADAYFSRRDIDRKLEIMVDSRVGAFAVITLVGYIGLMWVFVYEVLLNNLSINLVFVPIISRIMQPIMLYNLSFAKDDGLAKMYNKALQKKHRFLLYGAYVVVSIIYIICFRGFLVPVIALISYFIYKRFSYKNFGGITGDIIGAYLLLLELFLVIGIYIERMLL